MRSSVRLGGAFDWIQWLGVWLTIALIPWLSGCGEEGKVGGNKPALGTTGMTTTTTDGDGTSTGTGQTSVGGGTSTASTTSADQCQEGSEFCDGDCVDVSTSSEHCGACGEACEVGHACTEGACSTGCVEPYTECNGVCVELNRDSSNCGSCGDACEQGLPCVGGACGCPDGTLLCQGQCIDPNSNPAHCGACDEACALGGNCSGGSCGCPGGKTLCGDACVSLATSEHCGSCEATCSAGQLCALGECILESEGCPSPTVRCGSGCVDVMSDPGNCGTCDSTCPTAEACYSGACGCPDGLTACDGTCIDVEVSPLHCGGCGQACTNGQTCDGGSCQCTDDSLTVCGNQCANLDSATDHCGACGAACSDGLPCTDGECRCPDGETLCGGVCVDTESEPLHCGACGVACPEGEACIIGRCSTAVGDDCTSTLAHGISVTEVAVYQAGKISVMKGGLALAPDARDVDVVAGKDAVVRVFVDLEEGFANRVLSARLSLVEGENVERLFHKRTVDSPTVENSLGTSFNIEVAGELIKPSTRYVVEVVECGTDSGTEFSPRFPAEGDEALGAREVGIVRLEFVPLVVNSIEASADPSRLEGYRAALEAMYPVSGVEYTVGEALEIQGAVNAAGNGWEAALQQLAQRHQDRDAPNDVYYYGLMQPAATLGEYCSGGCVAGIGYVPEPDPYFAHARVSTGISYADDASWTTMAHEVGHNHGREHAPCGGAAYAGYFPHEGAHLGWWGFVHPATLIASEQATDIMGYCPYQWVSDFTYQALLERVVTINSALRWINPHPVGHWEVIVTSAFGARWGVPPSREVSAMGAPEAASVIDRTGNEIAQVTVYRARMDHLSGASIMVPAAESGWHAIVVDGVPPMVYGSSNTSTP